MAHVRAQIRLTTQEDIGGFIKALCDGTNNHYSLENFDGSERANARSILGVMYAAGDYPDEMFLVNDTIDGFFPSGIDIYRA